MIDIDNWPKRHDEVESLFKSITEGEIQQTKSIYDSLNPEVKDHLRVRCEECFNGSTIEPGEKNKPLLSGITKLEVEYGKDKNTNLIDEEVAMCKTLGLIYQADQTIFDKLKQTVDVDSKDTEI